MTREIAGNGVSSTRRRTVYVGPFVHSKTLQKLEICENGIIGVDESGKIAFVEGNSQDVSATCSTNGWTGDYEQVRIKQHGFFFPGFIDTHIHASQYPNVGIFGKSTLLDWLNTYTFPLESSFSDLKKASKIYRKLVSRTLSHGTTTAAYYATIHVPATNLLADICQEKGQRAFVGRVCMNSTLSPDFYRDESVEDVINKTQACIEHTKNIDPHHDLITPIITPRFAPSCTKECLSALGQLHQSTGYPVQTHLSENAREIALVKELFPESESYTAVYDETNLLSAKTILAHAIHLTPSERTLIQTRNSKISHCPASNTAITSGCCPVRELLDLGIDIGLGTDVSGGYSVSILEAVRQAIWVSRHIAMGGESEEKAKISVEEALFLGTRGGARVLGLEGRVGGFEVGFDWDAQMVDLGGDVGWDGDADADEKEVKKEVEGDGEGTVDVFGWESWEDRVHKWAFGGDDRNTVAVWVKGRLVHSTARYRP